LQQVEDALAALRGDRLRLARLRLAADAAANAALLAGQRYRSGLIDFQTVLDTQRTRYATLDGVVSATGDVGSGQVRLFRALGGGWPSADQGIPGGWPSADQPTSGGWPPSLDTPNR
jgi:outer membrane protein TolC